MIILVIPNVVYIFIVILPLVILFLLPFIASYIKGKKDLERASQLYITLIEKNLRKYKNLLIKQREGKDILEMEYFIDVPSYNAKLLLNVSLIERRTYVYYMYKIFGHLPDFITIRGNTEKKPIASLIIVSRKRKKILSKLMDYLSQLQEIEIRGLSKDLIFASDHSRYAKRYLTKDLLEKIFRIRNEINFIFIDYSQPNIDISCEITEKNASEVITSIFSMITILLRNLNAVKGVGKETEISKYLRRVLTEIRH